MDVELHQMQQAIERTEARIKQVDIESKQTLDKVEDLKSKLSLVSTCLAAAKEDAELLQTDLQNLGLSKEKIIKTAWDKRDAAVDAKNKAEIELAGNRVEMMQVNSQLMEAVKQKISLSEEL